MFRMTIAGSDMDVVLSSQDDQRYHWKWNDRSNQDLQVFFFLNDWEGYTEEQKRRWLIYATREIISSSILPTVHDQCEWTVTKRVEGTTDVLVTSSKQIRIQGLSAFLPTISKKPLWLFYCLVLVPNTWHCQPKNDRIFLLGWLDRKLNHFYDLTRIVFWLLTKNFEIEQQCHCGLKVMMQQRLAINNGHKRGTSWTTFK